MYRFTLILAFLLIAAFGQAQSPKLSLHADGGLCRTFITYYDGYANLYQRNNFVSSASVSAAIRLGRAVDFRPEVGIALSGLRFDFESGSNIRLYSNLFLGYCSIAPQLDLKLHPRFAVTPGFAVLVSSFTFGSFQKNSWSSQTGPIIENYAGHLTSIRKPVIWGPRLSLNWQVTKQEARPIGIRLGGQVIVNTLFGHHLDPTPYNPYQFQLTAGASYGLFEPKAN